MTEQPEQTKEEPEHEVVEQKIESPIEKATQVAERIEKANQESAALLERHEALKVQEIIGGESTAGQIPEKPDAEQIVKDRVNKQLEGTGLSI